MVKTKFKQTEIGLIPEDWKVYTVLELIDLLTDYDANGSFSSVAENVKTFNYQEYAWYVRSTDLENNSQLNNVKYVDKSSYDFLKKTSLYGDELLFLKRGDIGNVYLFKMRTEKATLAPNLYLLKLNNVSSSNYLYQYFISDRGQKQLKSKNASSTLGALYKDDVKSILVPLPPLPEQQAIAKVLNDADAWIESLEKLMAKKQLIKQGAMQQLLKPKEDWEVKKLGSIGKTYGGLSGKTKQDFGAGNAYYLPFLNIINNIVIDKNHIEKVNLKQGEYQNRVLKEDLLFNGSSETPEELGISSVLLNEIDDLYLNSFCFGFRLFDEKINPLFLSYLMRSSYGRKVIFFLAQGATRYNLSKSNFLELEISFPSTEKQTRIANILSDMDTEIEALEQKLAKAKQIKQGLMQELLTGIIRLV